jgi:hypothetical protein
MKSARRLLLQTSKRQISSQSIQQFRNLQAKYNESRETWCSHGGNCEWYTVFWNATPDTGKFTEISVGQGRNQWGRGGGAGLQPPPQTPKTNI